MFSSQPNSNVFPKFLIILSYKHTFELLAMVYEPAFCSKFAEYLGTKRIFFLAISFYGYLL